MAFKHLWLSSYGRQGTSLDEHLDAENLAWPELGGEDALKDLVWM